MNLAVAIAATAAVPTMMRLNSKIVTIKIEVATQANVVTVIVIVTAVVVVEATIMMVEAVIVIATIENELLWISSSDKK